MKRTYVLSMGGAVAVLLGSLAYILGPILHTPIGQSAAEISVNMDQSGGLFVGSSATYRGIVVGKVTAIDLTGSGVRATVRLNPGTQVPEASNVQVRSLSPIGEQYVDFQPSKDDGRYLKNGDQISAEAVDLPRTVADLSISLDKLMSEVDPGKVRSVLTELGTGLDGADDDLQRLIANGMTLTTSVDSNSSAIAQLLAQSNALLHIGADKSATMIAATRSFAVFSHWLRQFQPELYRILAKGPGQVEQLRSLISDLSQVLPGYLNAQGSLAQILQARDPHLRTLLQSFPLLLESFGSTMRGGSVHLDVLMRHGPQCVYDVTPRDARDTTYRKLQDGGYCSTSLTTYSQRGAQFAPPPVN